MEVLSIVALIFLSMIVVCAGIGCIMGRNRERDYEEI